MHVSKVSRLAQKDMRNASKRIILERAEADVAKQIDIFCATIDNYAPSLDRLIIQAQTYKQGSDERIRILQQAMKYHAGLGAMIGKRFGKWLEYGEVLGYMWEAFDQVLNGWYKETVRGLVYMEGWNPSKGRASTFLNARTSSLVWDHIYKSHTRGSVFIPMRSKRFSGAAMSTIEDLDARKDFHHDLDWSIL